MHANNLILWPAGKVAGVAGTPGAQGVEWTAASQGDGSNIGNANVGSFNGVFNGNVRLPLGMGL